MADEAAPAVEPDERPDAAVVPAVEVDDDPIVDAAWFEEASAAIAAAISRAEAEDPPGRKKVYKEFEKRMAEDRVLAKEVTKLRKKSAEFAAKSEFTKNRKDRYDFERKSAEAEAKAQACEDSRVDALAAAAGLLRGLFPDAAPLQPPAGF